MAGVAGIMIASQLGKLLGIKVDVEGFVPQVASPHATSPTCTLRRWCSGW